MRRTLRRWDVEQSLFTIVEMDLCGHWATTTLLMKPHGLLHSFWITDWNDLLVDLQSLCSYSVEHIPVLYKYTNHLSCGFYFNFYWRLASKASIYPSDPPLIGPRPWCHTPRLIVTHVVFRSLLKIFEYAAKQACKQLQCNKAKLSEPASINGLRIHRGLG